MSREVRLTPELSAQIVAAIRAGGYPYVAAEAWGVSKETFDDWLARGNRKSAWEPFRSFAHGVRQAFAQARLRAEVEGYNKDPKLWLINGPGRESEQRPGWSTSVKPADREDDEHNVLLHEELMQTLQTVASALAQFPDAKARVIQVLEKAKLSPKP